MTRDRAWGAFSGIVVMLAAAYAFVRTAHIPPVGDDIVIWIRMHEVLSRGGTLYETVWDHKDPGFFLISMIPYALWSTLGLYLVGFALVGAFGAGVYLCLRQITEVQPALLLAAIGVVLYVAPFMYYSVFVEHQAVAALVLAAGLSFKYPKVSGAVFALACAIKIGSAIPFGLVVATYLGLALAKQLRERGRPREWCWLRLEDLRWFKLVIGFSVMFTVVVLFVAAIGSLGGWLDAISYNTEYARIHGSLPIGTHNFVELWQNGLSYINIRYCLVLTITLLAVLGIVALVQRLAVPERRDEGDASVRRIIVLEPIVVSFALFLGTLIALLPQTLYVHYYQYPYGALVLLLVVCYTALIRSLALMQSIAVGIAMIGAVGFVIANPMPNLEPNHDSAIDSIAADFAAWPLLNTKGSRLEGVISRVPPEASGIAIFSQNYRRVDLRSAPESLKVVCRFHFQFEHLLSRYGSEMSRCLDIHPDVVVWENEGQRGPVSADYTAFRRTQLERLHDDYVVCPQPDPDFTLFALNGRLCPAPVG